MERNLPCSFPREPTVRARREIERHTTFEPSEGPGDVATALMVWIDQDLCTGDGICSEICPDVFVARDDGLWVVKEEAAHFGATIIFDGAEGAGHGPDNGRGVAQIPDSLIDLAVDAAEECPGECIMIEPYDQAAIDTRGA